jgi:hypothetical protein
LKEGKKDHDTGQDIKKDIGDVITQRVKFPNPVIDGITKDPDGLVCICFLKREYLFDPTPTQISNVGILVNHSIVPIGELVPQGIEVEYGDQYRNNKTGSH